jgi:hypothetical protein
MVHTQGPFVAEFGASHSQFLQSPILDVHYSCVVQDEAHKTANQETSQGDSPDDEFGDAHLGLALGISGSIKLKSTSHTGETTLWSGCRETIF